MSDTSSQGNEKILSILLKNPERLNAPVTGSKTPLWEATMIANREMIELLIKKRVNVNKWYVVDKYTNEKITFFQWLVASDDWEKNVQFAEESIRRGVNINATLNENTIITPLHLAVSKRNVQCVKFLLDNGAIPRDPESLIKTLMKSTHTNGYREILTFLMHHGLDIIFRNDSGENLLHIVSRTADNHRNKYALHNTYKNIVEICEFLLDSGVPLDQPCNKGYLPFHWAVKNQNFKLVSLLLKRGADVNKKIDDKDGWFPLFEATGNKNIKMVKFLVSKGANVHEKTSDGWTVMHEACVPKHESLISFYLQKGVLFSVETNNTSQWSDPDTPFSIWREWEDYQYFNEIPEGEHFPYAYELVKEIAKQQFDNNFPVMERDLNIIMKDFKLNQHYKICINELPIMAQTVFYAPYTYYSVLKMFQKIKRLANLTKNQEFLNNFYENVSLFPTFEKNLRDVMKQAIQVRNKAHIVETKLKNVLGNFFPSFVMRKLASFLSIKDLSVQ